MRARDLGIRFDGEPGPLNAITDVAGVEVGHATLLSGDGPLQVGIGPVRTGVTAIHPRGKSSTIPVFAGWFSLNGNGEMTGAAWIEESGMLDGPVVITNTHSVGVARDAVVGWQIRQDPHHPAWLLPVVAETYDGFLNDIDGFHVKAEHVLAALDGARGGPVAEGNVGGGTGMVCYGFKGGIGTSSRHVTVGSQSYFVGALVQANMGASHQLRIDGVPVGREVASGLPLGKPDQSAQELDPRFEKEGSIIAVIATEAPLLPHQLKRIARRAAMGLARTGSTASNSSGDLFLAFSTANAALADRPVAQVAALANADCDPLFEAAVEATEEAIVNSLVAAKTMTGIDGHRVTALPHDRLREVMVRYGRGP